MNDEETRKALQEIRETVNTWAQQTQHNTKELTELKQALTDHNAACAKNKELLDIIAEGIGELKVSMKWANRARKILLFWTPFIGAGVALFEYLKGRF